MGPVEGVLMWLVGAAVLVGAGYLLGRIWPASRHRTLGQHASAQDRPRNIPRQAGPASHAASATRSRRPPARRAMDERLQREIEHVQALRRARENAEPWLPPAVDAVGSAADRVWFADTAVEPHTPGPVR